MNANARPGGVPGDALLATVSVSGSTTVTVVVNDTEVVVNGLRGTTYAIGDVTPILRIGAEWWALGRAFAAPTTLPSNPAAPPPKPPVTTGSLVVSPVETRSYRSTVFTGWRTDNTDVYQGQYGGAGLHTGAVFYGSKPRSLAGATVTSARIRVRRKSGGIYAAQATTMRLMTNATRPAGAPTLTSSTAGPSLAVGATNDGFGIPISWAQAMVDGTAGGLAFFDADGSPYVVFAGRGTWSPAFTLTINWRR